MVNQDGQNVYNTGHMKANTRKDKIRQAYYQSGMVRQLKCNLKGNSIDVKPEWDPITEFSKQSFDRLPNLKPVLLDNVRECGDIMAYDASWDRTTAKKPKTLKHFDGVTFEEPLFDDPVMVELIEEDVADIFTTDVIAATLMCATKSNYSWDVEIKKYEGKIFIDKRQDEEDKEDNILNYYTVNETALDGQPESDTTINGIQSLMREATKINNSFLNASQDPSIARKIQLDKENPFIEDENQKVNRVGYVYKIWKLQEEDKENDKRELKICIRCSVHSHLAGQKNDQGAPCYMNVYSVNEFDTNLTQWRSKLDNSIITCLNQEITNNSFKFTKWLVQSLLAEVDFMKIAFVSRKDQSANNKHVVLGTHTVQTKSWAKQLNLDMSSLWSNIRHIVHIVDYESSGRAVPKVDGEALDEAVAEEEKKRLEAGIELEQRPYHEYILLKDSNKLAFRLYKKELEDEDEGEEGEGENE